MSRIGVVPVTVPQGVSVTITGNNVAAKGPKGALDLQTSGNISVSMEQDQITVVRAATRPSAPRRCTACIAS